MTPVLIPTDSFRPHWLYPSVFSIPDILPIFKCWWCDLPDVMFCSFISISSLYLTMIDEVRALSEVILLHSTVYVLLTVPFCSLPIWFDDDDLCGTCRPINLYWPLPCHFDFTFSSVHSNPFRLSFICSLLFCCWYLHLNLIRHDVWWSVCSIRLIWNLLVFHYWLEVHWCKSPLLHTDTRYSVLWWYVCDADTCSVSLHCYRYDIWWHIWWNPEYITVPVYLCIVVLPFVDERLFIAHFSWLGDDTLSRAIVTVMMIRVISWYTTFHCSFLLHLCGSDDYLSVILYIPVLPLLLTLLMPVFVSSSVWKLSMPQYLFCSDIYLLFLIYFSWWHCLYLFILLLLCCAVPFSSCSLMMLIDLLLLPQLPWKFLTLE